MRGKVSSTAFQSIRCVCNYAQNRRTITESNSVVSGAFLTRFYEKNELRCLNSVGVPKCAARSVYLSARRYYLAGRTSYFLKHPQGGTCADSSKVIRAWNGVSPTTTSIPGNEEPNIFAAPHSVSRAVEQELA